MTDVVWTDELVDVVKDLFTRGKSSNQVAQITGISRGAIAGKIRRLGLKMSDLSGNLPQPKKEPKAQAKRRDPYRPDAKKLRSPARKLIVVTTKENCTLDELTIISCRWPLWEHSNDPNKLFCGAKVEFRSPYCKHHTHVARFGSYRMRIEEPVTSLVTNTVPKKSPKSIEL